MIWSGSILPHGGFWAYRTGAQWGFCGTYLYDASARFAPATSKTAGAPTATSEATFPSESTSTAEGVPLAPKLLPTLNPWSSTTGELRPIALLSSTVPAETTSILAAPSGGLVSQALRSSSIRWQKPQSGFQKRTRVSLPLKSARSTVLPP